jgi:hypothetical protein
VVRNHLKLRIAKELAGTSREDGRFTTAPLACDPATEDHTTDPESGEGTVMRNRPMRPAPPGPAAGPGPPTDRDRATRAGQSDPGPDIARENF